jgi:hypothetical protein
MACSQPRQKEWSFAGLERALQARARTARHCAQQLGQGQSRQKWQGQTRQKWRGQTRQATRSDSQKGARSDSPKSSSRLMTSSCARTSSCVTSSRASSFSPTPMPHPTRPEENSDTDAPESRGELPGYADSGALQVVRKRVKTPRISSTSSPTHATSQHPGRDPGQHPGRDPGQHPGRDPQPARTGATPSSAPQARPPASSCGPVSMIPPRAGINRQWTVSS